MLSVALEEIEEKDPYKEVGDCPHEYLDPSCNLHLLLICIELPLKEQGYYQVVNNHSS